MIKKYVSYAMIIISVILLMVGIYFLINKNVKTPVEKKELTINEASELLYKDYIIENNEQYYYFVNEDEKYFWFKLSGDTQEKTYLVNKKTLKVLVSYSMQ